MLNLLKDKKKLLIILALLTLGAVLLFRKKTNAQTEPEAIKGTASVTERPQTKPENHPGEQTAIAQMKDLIGAEDYAWVMPLARKNSESGNPDYRIKGERDDAVALGLTIFQVAINPKGKYTRPGFPPSTKFLWSEDTLAQVHQIYTIHRADNL